MILAISNIAWAPEDRLAAYDLMAAAEVLGLEIAPSIFFYGAENPFAPGAAEAKRAMSEISAAGLRLVSMQSLLFGVEGAALFGDATARSRFEQGMLRAIRLAERFSIPNLVFGSPSQRRIPDDLCPETAVKQAVGLFRRLGDHAADAGTVITIESNPFAYGTNFLNTLAEADSFVVQVAHPNVASILDLGAMHMNGEFEDTASQIPNLMPRLNHVHVSEPHLAPAPADATQIAPVLASLRAAGYSKAVSIEMKRSDRGLEAVRERLAALKAASDAEGLS